MKRSEHVSATLIVAIAAGISTSGCGGTRTVRECVDAANRVVSDSYCISNTPGYRWRTRTVRTGGFGSSGYRGSGGYYGG